MSIEDGTNQASSSPAPSDSPESEARIRANILIYNPQKGYGRALENMLQSAYSSVSNTDSDKKLMDQLRDPNNEIDFIILENYDETIPELDFINRIRQLEHRMTSPIILIVPSRGQNFEKATKINRKRENLFIVQRPCDLTKIQRIIREAKKDNKLA